jgi:hypothetical protein
VGDLMIEQYIYNTKHFLSNILEPLLLAMCPGGRKPHSCRLIPYLDTCCVHRSKASNTFHAEKDIVWASRPPYSLDLARSDLWLFDRMKAALAGQRAVGPTDLLNGIQAFLDEIQRSELEHVFHHWIQRI